MAKSSHGNSGKRLMEGVVLQSTGGRSKVRVASGKIYDCAFRGKMRLKNIRATNPVAVGDKVIISIKDSSSLHTITRILPRKNYILRKAIAKSHAVHILCANIDQALLVITIREPHTTVGFVNRFLTIAEAYHIPVRIIINKVDLLTSPAHSQKMEEVIRIYEEVGYEVTRLSALDSKSREIMQEMLQDKVSFVGGHSGVGKSTLINMVDPDLDLKTGEISEYTQKGKHTTVFSQMLPLSIGGYIIDSPGIKEMGIVNLTKQELAHYFPEMRELLPSCKFSNCLHLDEPGCAVKEALETGEVHPSRYNSYLSMIEEMVDEPYK
ncbi:ribosome small subunit-dependent GTPase A [bacterium]|nr:ribosome small subunit-dependent GTPase A [bacterium]